MRIHGKRGMVYMALLASASPQPVAFLSDWIISFIPSFSEVTAYGDPAKLYVGQTPQISGSFTGFYDDSTSQFYTAARDGLPRNFYLYPDITDDPAQFWFGAMLPSFSPAGGVGDAVKLQCEWSSSSRVWLSLAASFLLDEAGAQITDEAGVPLMDEGGGIA